MENRAHISEPKEKRLARFSKENGEIIHTIISSIANFFNNEIKAVFDNPSNPQTSLMFLGIHSVALTIGYGLFGETGEKGFKTFLENFVDGDSVDTKFSLIASDIHRWRNVLAHRWLNVAGYEFNYDFKIQKGWEKDGNNILINPKIYLSHYLKAFDATSKLYRWDLILNTEQKVKEAKERFMSKYIEEL